MAARHVGNDIKRKKGTITKLGKKFAALFLSIIVGIAFTFSVFAAYKLVILKENMDSFAGYKVLSIVGDGMSPQFDSGDLIIVKSMPNKSFNVGDVISFYKESNVITHKIEEVMEDGFITKGDHDTDKDESLVNSSEVLGKYILCIPKGDYFLSFIKNPFFTFVIFLLLLFNISFLFRVFFR